MIHETQSRVFELKWILNSTEKKGKEVEIKTLTQSLFRESTHTFFISVWKKEFFP